MLLKEILKGCHIQINEIHPESRGCFVPTSTGIIDFIESDGAVWVNFDKGQIGVMEETHSLFVGNLNDCDELFEIIDYKFDYLQLTQPTGH